MTLHNSSASKILKEYGIRPNKGLGQNFLSDPKILKRIADTVDIQMGDTVLEIGAGIGNLTSELAARSSRVVAVELDERLIPILCELTSQFNNIEIISGDILDLDLMQLSLPEDYLVVGNIPYYISTMIVRRLLETSRPPRRIVLTLQREVAERIIQQPGHLNLLAVSVQVYGKPSIHMRIPAGSFYPAPEVDSAVIRIDRYPEARIPLMHRKFFFRLVKAGFSQKRKTLRNSISGGMGWKPKDTSRLLSESGIDPSRRAETVSLEEWYQFSLIAGQYGGE